MVKNEKHRENKVANICKGCLHFWKSFYNWQNFSVTLVCTLPSKRSERLSLAVMILEGVRWGPGEFCLLPSSFCHYRHGEYKVRSRKVLLPRWIETNWWKWRLKNWDTICFLLTASDKFPGWSLAWMWGMVWKHSWHSLRNLSLMADNFVPLHGGTLAKKYHEEPASNCLQLLAQFSLGSHLSYVEKLSSEFQGALLLSTLSVSVITLR